MKILFICLLLITLLTMTIQYNLNRKYTNHYRRQPNNPYNRNNNGNNNYDDNNNNDNKNMYDKYSDNSKYGNYYPTNNDYNKQKPKYPRLTRRYSMEGEEKHAHQKHGERHLKSIGELFGFTNTNQGSDYALTTTFHKGSIAAKNGEQKHFSTYETEGQVKHYQNTHGQAKFNLNAKLYGQEKYNDQKEMKATVKMEDYDNTPDDEANYSPVGHPYGKLEGY
uniref:Trematode Eggshell Synthesis,domain-containing protein n=1 Tax=Schistosoma japonicum TaxID=6182 RepID=C1L955_SCHJA|nr:Trematode Eggshell Synthesis,domain-containing protein [Schistosoma japonicum]CAX71227.1 Trematode Eggshell Synthesis,domain-containing protein [Schistosoma japonicum]CAX71228.1 Trematode Eggshell Synthesis,domain-containing protein [Schistosoma japonicum]CAX71229.1 Trematode Eggshell Synthesis,domain-containing protein [Schistosoma japonicum]CAX71230.1 Trematode Eggshell Synthesis,domain-containing protein [Schistosoma japonicum]